VKLRHLCPLGAGALLVGCSAPAPAPLPPPTTTATTATKAEVPHGPYISLRETDAAMGLRATPILLANCGSDPVTLNGYPALRVLDQDHKPLDVTVINGSDSVASVPNLGNPPTAVTLAPGDEAIATVLWKNTVTDANVVATSGTYFDIAPATGQPWQTREPHGPIDVGNTGKVGVSPWAPSKDKGDCHGADAEYS
jgi:hypothetical protein